MNLCHYCDPLGGLTLGISDLKCNNKNCNFTKHYKYADPGKAKYRVSIISNFPVLNNILYICMLIHVQDTFALRPHEVG